MPIADMWTPGTAIASLVVTLTLFQQHLPYQLQNFLNKYFNKFLAFFNPYVQITFHEYTGEYLMPSEAYANIQNYLSENSSSNAKKLKANVVKDSRKLVFSMDDYEEISDEYNGIEVWWASSKRVPQTQRITWGDEDEERRFFRLTVHRRNRDIIKPYIDHVTKLGKEIALKNRQRKLYTNNPSSNWNGYRATKWSHVMFEHPATFDTLAMSNKMKKEIMDDLLKFSKGKDYYAKIGKAWKRGYLLYGPPGTGKSTMISAMANLLNYDVYDLELTTVKDNSELRKLLIDTKSKSIVVIEDIDCSLDLTGKRKPKREKDEDDDEKKKDPISEKKKKDEEESKNESKVTLSGLLNCIDGIWSACGGEKIIVFTTNYVEKLDQALIRRGRMDKHIEMSYCCFEGFKILAKNYLDIEYHELFSRISNLFEVTKMITADVAENLMPKSDEEDAETCLKKLISALEENKAEEDRKEAEKEAKLKAEQASKESEPEKEKSAESVKENGFISNGNGHA